MYLDSIRRSYVFGNAQVSSAQRKVSEIIKKGENNSIKGSMNTNC